MEISIKWNVCRICLAEEQQQQTQLPSGESGAQMKQLFHDDKLAKQIYRCSGIKMKSGDALPDKICRKCLTLLSHAVNFRNICRNSNDYLQSVINQTKSAASMLKLDRRREQPLESLVEEEEPVFDYSAEESDSGGVQQEEVFVDDSVADKPKLPVQLIKVIEHKNNKQETSEEEVITSDMIDDADAQSEHEHTSGQIKEMEKSKNALENEIYSVAEEEEHEAMKTAEAAVENKKIILNKLAAECISDENSYMDEIEYDPGLKSFDNVVIEEKSKSSRDIITDDGIEATAADEKEKVDVNEYFYIINVNDIKQENSNENERIEDINAPVEIMQMYDDVSNNTAEEGEYESAAGTNEIENIEYLDEEDEEGSPGDFGTLIPQTQKNLNKTLNRPPAKVRKDVGGKLLFICYICGNNFTSRNILNCHIRTHRPERNFECELCFKKFRTSSNLTSHMRTHTGEKPYECQFCGRYFGDRSTHIKHERVHTNEKPFHCTTCGKSFALSTTLRAHEKTHSNEKPHRCQPCGKSFKLIHQLRAHCKTHQHKVLASSDVYTTNILIKSDDK